MESQSRVFDPLILLILSSKGYREYETREPRGSSRVGLFLIFFVCDEREREKKNEEALSSSIIIIKQSARNGR